ncbi:MAG: hypothetical protein PSV40_14825 [Polaromonas sp.]|uniref:alginate O-acetyltransferase AlgX-related protein n=1 Tax=Polaromonas sp. TaxID=1869339 RepID=UPI0024898503|nr:hypothetical protein [Polaromonas sp.]MDI1270357.1 hypothetical protein [Polaromonas sp.]
MKPDRNFVVYVAWFSGTALVLLLAAIGLSLFFKPLSGDLTRIGKWPERDFGPTLLQSSPVIQANGPLLTHQQILVLGDSFSHPNIWQSYLFESSKLETLSFEFKDVGCIDNWLNWVVAQTASDVRTIIIEVAERSFVPVFRSDRRCASSTPLASAAPDKTRSTSLIPGVTLDAFYLVQTAGNALRIRWQAGSINSGEAINVPLSNANLFSNIQANRLLYYAEDDSKKTWTQQDIAAAVENLKNIQNRLGKLRLVIVVVPDKSTVYRSYMLRAAATAEYPDIFSSIAAAGVDSVDLRNLFQKNVANTIDLYLPNDTHLSPSGYRIMASAIAERLQTAGEK